MLACKVQRLKLPNTPAETGVRYVGHINILITCNCIYIYNKIAVYSVSGKANLYIDIKDLILINMCLLLLISNCLVLS